MKRWDKGSDLRITERFISLRIFFFCRHTPHLYEHQKNCCVPSVLSLFNMDFFHGVGVGVGVGVVVVVILFNEIMFL